MVEVTKMFLQCTHTPGHSIVVCLTVPSWTWLLFYNTPSTALTVI